MDREAREYSQLVVDVRAPAIGLFEFHQIDEAIEAGRRAALAALEASAPVLG